MKDRMKGIIKTKCVSGGEIMWEGHDFEAGTRHTLFKTNII
jgi:hypothetical protein